MRKITIITLLTFGMATACLAQNNTGEEDSVIISENEVQLSKLFDSLRNSENDSMSIKLSTDIEQMLGKELQNPASFTMPYNSLKNLGKCYSDDNKVRVYSWAFALSDKSMRYGCYIQVQGKKGIKTYQLHNTAVPYIPDENKTINPNQWYGSIYYNISFIPQKKKSQYIMLGWGKGNVGCEYKTIEVLDLDKNGNLLLGADDLFNKKGKKKKRMVFQYSDQVHMALDYDPISKKIIFDHLVPSEQVYTGIYSYYGPDFTYDAYSYDKKQKMWMLEENVDAKNKE